VEVPQLISLEEVEEEDLAGLTGSTSTLFCFFFSKFFHIYSTSSSTSSCGNVGTHILNSNCTAGTTPSATTSISCTHFTVSSHTPFSLSSDPLSPPFDLHQTPEVHQILSIQLAPVLELPAAFILLYVRRQAAMERSSLSLVCDRLASFVSVFL
jgi:hypothetical protein